MWLWAIPFTTIYNLISLHVSFAENRIKTSFSLHSNGAHKSSLSLFSLLKGHLKESFNRNYYEDYYYNFEFSQIAGKCSSNHIFFSLRGALEFLGVCAQLRHNVQKKSETIFDAHSHTFISRNLTSVPSNKPHQASVPWFVCRKQKWKRDTVEKSHFKLSFTLHNERKNHRFCGSSLLVDVCLHG